MSKLPSFSTKQSRLQQIAKTIVLIAAFFLLFSACITQWFAAQYNYSESLGEGLFTVLDVVVYMPFEWVSWTWEYSSVPALKANVQIMMLSGEISIVAAMIAGMAVFIMMSKKSVGMEGLHGSARWAEYEDIDRKGFIDTDDYKSKGVVIGSVMLDKSKNIIHPFHKHYTKRMKPDVERGKGFKYFQVKHKRNGDGELMYKPNPRYVKKVTYLRDNGKTHIYAFCPTRSGKGVALITPTLLTWEHSVFVNDPKGESYALTSGFRKQAGQYIIKFEPACTNGTGACWNPLGEIRKLTNFDVQDAQMIMSMLCDPDGEGLKDYFDKAAFEFLMGLSLHMVYAEKNPSLQGMAMFMGDPAWEPDKQMYQHMMNADHDPDGIMNWVDSYGKPTKTHPVIANVAKTMLNKEDKDRSGVLSTAKSLLSLYLDPIVALNTSRSDFLVRDMMTREKPVSLYYVVSPVDMERMRPLTRLFYALFLRRNAADMEFANGQTAKTYTFQMLMIIDEMISLKKLPILEEALSYVAGYGIRMFLLSQDITQVEAEYGDKQSIDSGAATRIVYAPNKIETAEKLARMTGKTTITEEKESLSYDKLGIKAGSVSLSTEKIARDLFTAEEFNTLSYQDMVIFIAGQAPIYGRKAFFYDNPEMRQRVRIAPPKQSDILRPSEQKKVETQQVAPDPIAEAVNNSKAEIKKMVDLGKDGVGIMAMDGNIVLQDRRKQNSGSDGQKLRRYGDNKVELTAEEKQIVSQLVGNVELLERVNKITAVM